MHPFDKLKSLPVYGPPTPVLLGLVPPPMPPAPKDVRRPRERQDMCRRCEVVVVEQDSRPPWQWLFCPQCLAELSREWEQQTSAKTHESRLRQKYGLELEDHGAIFRAQGGACAICECTDRKLVVDHDHKTGEVRGLLCSQCNSAIGLLRDDAEVIVAAAMYVRGSRRPGVKKVKRANAWFRVSPWDGSAEAS